MINLKPARRQAYRYGTQAGLLIEHGGDDDSDVKNVEALQRAYRAFLRQFDALDCPDVARDWLREEYMRGFCGVTPLTGGASHAGLAHVAAMGGIQLVK